MVKEGKMKIFGFVLIMSPFIAVFVWSFSVIGFKETLKVFGITFGIIFIMGLGQYLIIYG